MMSNPKYRTPLLDKESQTRVINKAIDLGQEIEKHKQKTIKPGDIFEGSWSEIQGYKHTQIVQYDNYWNRNIFTRAMARFGRWIRW